MFHGLFQLDKNNIHLISEWQRVSTSSGTFAIEIVDFQDFFAGLFAIVRIRFAIRTYEIKRDGHRLS
ncbi:hypothetical protein EF849_12935 [Aeromonas jandaei]|nr:hypothetical protein [Aeromonas jandaei]